LLEHNKQYLKESSLGFVTTLAAATERRSASSWLTVARGRSMVIASRAFFGVLSRRVITASVAVVWAARTLALPLTHTLSVASGVGNKNAVTDIAPHFN